MTASNSTSGTPHGPWRILQTNQVYEDPWLHVKQDNVIRPDGLPGTHSVVTIKSGICVLAFEGDLVYLTKEFHYAVGRVTIEAVSGGREDNEDPLECAKRELAEELGIVADSWQQLTTVDPFTASVVSPVTIFLATNLTFQEARPEGTEQIQCVTMTTQTAFDAVCNGTITHTPTCIAILQHYISRVVPADPGVGER